MAKCTKCGQEEIPVCPECHRPVDVYSRVVGYLRPISTWNPGKQQEFVERKEYLFWGADHIDYDTDLTEKKHE